MSKKHQESDTIPVDPKAGAELTAENTKNKTAEENHETPAGNEGPPAVTREKTESERITQLEQELQKAVTEKEEHYNRMLRTQADFENFRRRSRQEYEQACLYGGEDLLKKILPVLDSLERAIASGSDSTGNNGLLDGVRLTLKQFQNILAVEGLETIESLNHPFDPQIHEAVLQEQSDTVSEPTVLEELQKGYKYKNKLLRPALVKVAVP